MDESEIQNITHSETTEVIKKYIMDVTTVSTLCAFFGEKRLIGAEVIGKVNPMKIHFLQKRAKRGSFKVDEEKHNLIKTWKEMRYSISSLELYTGKTSRTIAYNDEYILDIAFDGKEYTVTQYQNSPERLKNVVKSYCFGDFTCAEDKDENFVCELTPEEFDSYIESSDLNALALKWNVSAEALKNAQDPVYDAIKEKIVGTFGIDDCIGEKGYMVKSIKTANNIYFVKDGEGKIVLCGGDADFVAEQIVRF